MPRINNSFLADFSIPLVRKTQPLQWVGPIQNNPVGITYFTNIEQWRLYVVSLQFKGVAPEQIRAKHEHVLRVLFLSWLDAAVIKTAEMAVLATLEAAIKMRYPETEIPTLEKALKHLIKHSKVTDNDLPVVRQSGGTVVKNLLRTSKDGSGSGLSEIRNRLAHGDPLEFTPWAGLFEVVRDLVDFMYPNPTS